MLVFVGLDRLVGPDPHAQAALTAEILVAVGTAFLLYAVIQTRRERRADDEEDDA